MSQPPFPAPGPDGDEPPRPGAGARDGAVPAEDGAVPAAGGEAAAAGGPPADPAAGGGDDDDFDADADLARFLADVDAGLIPIPPEPPESLADMPSGPGVWFTLGEAADVNPAELAVMAGPAGLGGQVFASDRSADAMRPGPLLSILTEQAAEDPVILTDDELMGLVSAARRLQARAEYLELAGIAEFARRRQAQHDTAVAGGVKPGRRPGEFADEELGFELVMRAQAAGDRMDMATALATRLPRTFAAMAAGMIDGGRACTIWYYTRFLSDEHAALADAILAEAAPGLRQDQLEGKAYRLELKLDPEAVRARREHARATRRRVETRREPSGNLCYGARELSVEEGLAAKAANDADAAALRAAGMPGSLRELRVLAFLDRQAGRDPLDRIEHDRDGGHRYQGWDDEDEDDEGNNGGPGDGGPGHGCHPGPGGRAAAPLPALINLIVPGGPLFGWSTAPGEAGGWGLLDPNETRNIVQTASRHPRTRWCVTVTGPDGTAVAHGCARGQHPWIPPPTTTGTSGSAPPGNGPLATGPPGTGPPPGPDQYQAAQLAALLRALNVRLSPVASGTCDHRDREDRYTPSRRLGHLVRARTATCVAPGCAAQAYHCDLDHTIPYPQGPTCPCNLGPGCRRHHRVKQAPGWHLEQPEPGIMRWTTPSGRTYTTRPTSYDV